MTKSAFRTDRPGPRGLGRILSAISKPPIIPVWLKIASGSRCMPQFGAAAGHGLAIALMIGAVC
jgi:hypothetical protein